MWQQCMDSLKTQRRVDNIQDLMQLPTQELRKTDDIGYDLLHYAIIAQNDEIIERLSTKPAFKDPYAPDKFPYVHLACWVGRNAMLHLLLDQRPSDYFRKIHRSSLYMWNEELYNSCTAYCKGIPKVLSKQSQQLQQASADEDLSLIDFAALQENLKGLEVLLLCFGASSKHSLLESCVQLQSLYATRFLLAQNVPSDADCDAAFKLALLKKLPEFLDAILARHEVNVERVLNHMNPFHVMFMYSSAHQVHGPKRGKRFFGLDQCCEVLVRFGFSVNAKSPPGSYPLYSLITSMLEEYDMEPSCPPTYHLNSLTILLENGADPNFNECNSSLPNGDEQDILGITSVFGRQQFRSILHCFLYTLQKSYNWAKIGEMDFLLLCFDEIFAHGAKLDKATLNDAMYLLASQHLAQNYISFEETLLLFLKQGANPDSFQSEVESDIYYYPVTVYFQHLFSKVNSVMDFLKLKSNNAFMKGAFLMKYMSDTDRSNALQQITLISKGYDSKFAAEFLGVEPFSAQVHDIIVHCMSGTSRLSYLCKMTVWKAAHRKNDNLQRLGLPKKLSDSIMDIFDK